MNKTLLICACLVLLFCIQGALAITTDIKEEYLQGETVATEIKGNVIGAISSSNVELRRGHVLVPMEFELRKLGEEYFLWFITPKNEENYTLIIKNIPSTVSGQIEDVTYTKNFSTSANLSEYTIKPGFVYTSGDFDIAITLNEDEDKEINTDFLEETDRIIILKPGENTITFSAEEINETGMYNLSIEEFILPVYFKLNRTVNNIFVNESGEDNNLTNENASKLIENITEEINVTENESSAINQERAKYHCYEFPGKICEANQICSGQTITSSDGACCVNGNCISKNGGGGSYAWIGYLIAAIVIIAGIFIYLRYRKIKEEKNPLAKRVQNIENKRN